MALPRPGCVVRSALIIFALLFLPLGCWFAYANFRRYWPDALSLIVISVVFLWWALDPRDDSWIASIDELGPR